LAEDGGERTLHTVEDRAQQAGPQFDGQRVAEAAHRLTRAQPFVDS